MEDIIEDAKIISMVVFIFAAFIGLFSLIPMLGLIFNF